MIAIKEILVATDFGPAADNALRYGEALAREFSARLHVLHAVPNVYATSMDGYGYAAVPQQIQEDLETAARRHMREDLAMAVKHDLQAPKENPAGKPTSEVGERKAAIAGVFSKKIILGREETNR